MGPFASVYFKACSWPPDPSVSDCAMWYKLRMPNPQPIVLQSVVPALRRPAAVLLGPREGPCLENGRYFYQSLSPSLVEQTIKNESFLVVFREHSFSL